MTHHSIDFGCRRPLAKRDKRFITRKLRHQMRKPVGWICRMGSARWERQITKANNLFYWNSHLNICENCVHRVSSHFIWNWAPVTSKSRKHFWRTKNVAWRKSTFWTKLIHGWELLKIRHTKKSLKWSKWGFLLFYFSTISNLFLFILSTFKLREHGIQERQNLKIYRKRPLCDTHGQNFGSVRLIDCYAALLVLAYGFITSLLLLVCEKIAAKRKNRKLQFIRTNSMNMMSESSITSVDTTASIN